MTPQPGAPLGPSALSQEHGFAEATLNPFHLPTLTPSPLFGIVCGQYYAWLAHSNTVAVGSCLTLRNELSKETGADKARNFIGKEHPGGEQEGNRAQENCSATVHSLRFSGDGVSFHVVSGQSFQSRVFPSGMPITQPRWIPVMKDSGRLVGHMD